MPKGKGGFALTGKSKPAQFSPRVAGQRETGFRQKTEKQATAAMQGSPMPSSNPGNRWIKPARADARKQFTKAPGKAVF
jgi:hypothetical protein